MREQWAGTGLPGYPLLSLAKDQDRDVRMQAKRVLARCGFCPPTSSPHQETHPYVLCIWSASPALTVSARLRGAGYVVSLHVSWNPQAQAPPRDSQPNRHQPFVHPHLCTRRIA